MQEKRSRVGGLWDGLSLPCFLFFQLYQNLRFWRRYISTLSTQLVVKVDKENVFSCFLLSLHELAALISAAHKHNRRLGTRALSIRLRRAEIIRHYVACYFFPELCESKTQLQNQGTCASEWGRLPWKNQEHRERMIVARIRSGQVHEKQQVPATLRHTRVGDTFL